MRILCFVAALSGLFVVACGSADSGSSAEEDETLGKSHAATVRACDKTWNAALDAAQNNAEIRQSTATYTGCVKAANDAALPQIRKGLPGGLRDLAEPATARYRAVNNAVCSTLGDASASFGATMATIALTACGAETEMDLASLIDAYVKLGVKATPANVGAEERKACYEVFETQTKTLTSDIAYVGAQIRLLACLEEGITSIEPSLTSAIVHNNARPGSSSSQIGPDLHAQMNEHWHAADVLCSALTGSVTTPTREMYACEADARALLSKLVRQGVR